MKVKKNDNVKIMSGKDKGKTGKVIQVFPQERLVVVEGLNTRAKHLRARGSAKGQRILYPAPMTVSNVMVVCPSCSVASRLGKVIGDDGVKKRQCKKCKATFI
ncbi:MAG: 50S ribosomal protein L24 [Patescibacteria group bacterium]